MNLNAGEFHSSFFLRWHRLDLTSSHYVHLNDSPAMDYADGNGGMAVQDEPAQFSVTGATSQPGRCQTQCLCSWSQDSDYWVSFEVIFTAAHPWFAVGSCWPRPRAQLCFCWCCVIARAAEQPSWALHRNFLHCTCLFHSSFLEVKSIF